MTDYPQRVFRFIVAREDAVKFVMDANNPIFSEQEFDALDSKEKFRFLQEMPDVETSTVPLWEIARYHGEVEQWNG